jgi:hypothetical protein
MQNLRKTARLAGFILVLFAQKSFCGNGLRKCTAQYPIELGEAAASTLVSFAVTSPTEGGFNIFQSRMGKILDIAKDQNIKIDPVYGPERGILSSQGVNTLKYATGKDSKGGPLGDHLVRGAVLYSQFGRAMAANSQVEEARVLVQARDAFDKPSKLEGHLGVAGEEKIRRIRKDMEAMAKNWELSTRVPWADPARVAKAGGDQQVPHFLYTWRAQRLTLPLPKGKMSWEEAELRQYYNMLDITKFIKHPLIVFFQGKPFIVQPTDSLLDIQTRWENQYHK